MNTEPTEERSKFRCPSTFADFDYASNPSWRIFRIMAEFIDGFEFINRFQKSVTFFGSARLSPESSHYKQAEELSGLLAKAGFTIVTGGGPGIMEAANRGAALANGESIGLNIQLPSEQRTNPFVKRALGFHYFFTRKVMLSAASQAYVYFPGGLGTLDEFFEITTLVQTKKMERIPIIALGRHYWEPLFEWLKKVAREEHTMIDEADLNIWTLADSAEEAFKIIDSSKPRKGF